MQACFLAVLPSLASEDEKWSTSYNQMSFALTEAWHCLIDERFLKIISWHQEAEKFCADESREPYFCSVSTRDFLYEWREDFSWRFYIIISKMRTFPWSPCRLLWGPVDIEWESIFGTVKWAASMESLFARQSRIITITMSGKEAIKLPLSKKFTT